MNTNAATKELLGTLQQETARRLADLGFRPAKKQHLLMDLAAGFRGVFIPIWRLYSRQVVVGLSPHVGVIDLELEADISRRGGRLAPRYSTYQTHLINLVPDMKLPQGGAEILFDEGDEGRRAMRWFIDSIRSTAIPWMTGLASDEGLAAEIFRLDDLPGTASEVDLGMTAPLLELRLGHPERSLVRLDRHVDAIVNRHDAIGDSFRAFAVQLRGELLDRVRDDTY